MIGDITNIAKIISIDRFNDGTYNMLRATFYSSSKNNIKNLGKILQSDNISFVIKNEMLWRWKLIMEIPIIGNYNETEYHRVIGKFSVLASRCFVNLETMGLLG